MDGLIDLIQGLPQELQDHIIEAAIDMSVTPDVSIYPSTYKLPIGLQLNRKTRAQTAKVYYSNTLFIVTFEIKTQDGLEWAKLFKSIGCALKMWLEHLPDLHVEYISKIRVRATNASSKTWAIAMDIYDKCVHLRTSLMALQIECDDGVLWEVYRHGQGWRTRQGRAAVISAA